MIIINFRIAQVFHEWTSLAGVRSQRAAKADKSRKPWKEMVFKVAQLSGGNLILSASKSFHSEY